MSFGSWNPLSTWRQGQRCPFVPVALFLSFSSILWTYLESCILVRHVWCGTNQIQLGCTIFMGEWIGKGKGQSMCTAHSSRLSFRKQSFNKLIDLLKWEFTRENIVFGDYDLHPTHESCEIGVKHLWIMISTSPMKIVRLVFSVYELWSAPHFPPCRWSWPPQCKKAVCESHSVIVESNLGRKVTKWTR